ncbi:MAG: translesion error-prone DNA polymerase V autoproteolytic subunit [Verrucomicrobia bacterium]|nr:translesion error-prone DNA polymerase V autoproteolytic subunit [Verrucomicrobiota bacterium]
MKLPLFETPVQAGFPSPAEDIIERKLDLHELLIRHPASTFFVRASGSSMKDAGITSGDLLIVDRAEPARDGAIVVAIVSGEFTVKRLRKENGVFFLMPENKKFPPIEVTEDCEIWGVVTFVIHKCTP